jgi:excisionase family DNA binding protein
MVFKWTFLNSPGLGGMMEKISKTIQPTTIMTVRDVADYLRLSEATIYQMARQGRIPVLRMGRTWRFKKEFIDNWLETSTQKEKKTI